MAFVWFLSLGGLAGLALDEFWDWYILIFHFIGVDDLRNPIQDVLFPLLLVTGLPFEGSFLLDRL